MSSKKYAAPLRLEIGSSKKLLVLLVILHGLSFAVLFVLNLHIAILLSLGIGVISSAYYSISYHALKNLPSSIIGIVVLADGRWLLQLKSGQEIEAKIDGNSYVQPFCTILVFQCEDRFLSRSVVLLRDNVEKEDYRRLRVQLKVANFFTAEEGE